MKIPVAAILAAAFAMAWLAVPTLAQEPMGPPANPTVAQPPSPAVAPAVDPAPRPPGIVGVDNRVPIDSRAWPWSAIGRVNRATGGFCTGVLIGPSHVLTVAHCLYDKQRGKWTAAADLHFVAGYNRGDFVAHMQVERVVLPPDYSPLAPEDPRNLAIDWAIIVVRGSANIRPVRLQVLTPADIDAGLTDDALVRAGYGQDRAHMLSAHQGCSIVGWDRDLMLHDCDGTRGDSGSPVLMQSFGETTVVGLNIGFRESNDTILGIALPAASFHDAARNLMSGR